MPTQTGTSGNDMLTGTTEDDILYGLEGDDTLRGLAGNDILIGGPGNDRFFGGPGDDTYYVDAATPLTDIRTFENAGEGYDRVAASATYILYLNSELEQLDAINLNDTVDMDLQGNTFNNRITGNQGVNILKGQPGNDVLVALGGNDFLDGGTGIDAMYGGLGDDTYYVDDVLDLVNEAAGEGTDRVAAHASYALRSDADVEIFDTVNLTDTIAIDLTGNDLAQTIIGNAGANFLRGEGGNDILIGGGGNDNMVGGAGDDTFYIDDTGDVVSDFPGGGFERVVASVSFHLGSLTEIELLETAAPAGTVALDLTGSDTANTINGNDGVNFLRGQGGDDMLNGRGGDDSLVGGSGADRMDGGTDSDTFYVDDALDVVLDAVATGNDRVATSVSYTLGADADIEVLEAVNLTDTMAMNLIGNGFSQAVIGNNGANVLDGKNGADVLTGAGGADTFAFTTGLASFNVDRIADFLSGTDKIALDDAVFTGLTPGALPAGAFVIGTQAADADDRIIYNGATGQLFFDADGNGAGTAVLFATLDGHPTLVAGDFIVI
jgi:Ca2+-binding RTX toxin-like protein